MSNKLSPRIRSIGLAVASFLVCSSVDLSAEEIKTQLAGMHLCCGGCTAALVEALSEVPGVRDVDVKQKESAASFVTSDVETADAALRAVAKAGFGCTVKRQGETVDFPVEKLDKDATADTVVFTGLHLCCKGCANSVVKSFEDLPTVASVDCDLKKRTATLTGKRISLLAVQKRLMAAGFYGAVAK